MQPGDEDLDSVRFSEIRGQPVVIEEKLDGANSALSFGPDGRLWLQSRGHYLTGGKREKHFALFKKWAHAHAHALFGLVGKRYIVYGEWVYAKHTIFYDTLPHYFLEFDVFDRDEEVFLDTDRRHEMFEGSPVVSVPVLWHGQGKSLDHLHDLVGMSLYKSDNWKDSLRTAIRAEGLDPERLANETDPADEMEGLYIKVESGGLVTDRYKFVRASFLTSVVESGSHWLNRPIVPNRLAAGVDIFP